MRYVKEYNAYIDDDLVIYGNWACRKNREAGKLFQLEQYVHNGYNYVNTKINNNKYIVAPVHRIIALAFIPNPEGKPTVDHINRIKSDNTIENLRWATPKEQMWNREIVVHSRYGHVSTNAAEYMRNYRKANPEYVKQNRQKSKERPNNNKNVSKK